MEFKYKIGDCVRFSDGDNAVIKEIEKNLHLYQVTFDKVITGFIDAGIRRKSWEYCQDGHFFQLSDNPVNDIIGLVEDTKPQAAKKFDSDKPRMDLLPPQALEQIALALTFGAKKYGNDYNYLKGGMASCRLYAACVRHLCAWLRREDSDPETGLPHLAHAGACILMLLNGLHHGKLEDNRYNGGAS